MKALGGASLLKMLQDAGAEPSATEQHVVGTTPTTNNLVGADCNIFVSKGTYKGSSI